MEKLLGSELYRLISNRKNWSKINEIRIRTNKKILVRCFDEEFFVDFTADADYIKKVVLTAANNSLYAHEKEISDGYLDYSEGVRIGIVGSGTINNRGLAAYSSINALCIRVPHEITPKYDFGDLLKNFQNTLIIGAPYSGKTTLVRAFCRELSQNSDTTVIDERYEICGFGLSMKRGDRADVVQGIPKNIVFDRIIRSMSPQIVVCDELFSDGDIQAVETFSEAGIKCLASLHATEYSTLDDRLKRVFRNFITLSSKPVPGSIKSMVKKNDG
jgi:stage III sporulation protein AA